MEELFRTAKGHYSDSIHGGRLAYGVVMVNGEQKRLQMEAGVELSDAKRDHYMGGQREGRKTRDQFYSVHARRNRP